MGTTNAAKRTARSLLRTYSAIALNSTAFTEDGVLREIEFLIDDCLDLPGLIGDLMRIDDEIRLVPCLYDPSATWYFPELLTARIHEISVRLQALVEELEHNETPAVKVKRLGSIHKDNKPGRVAQGREAQDSSPDPFRFFTSDKRPYNSSK